MGCTEQGLSLVELADYKKHKEVSDWLFNIIGLDSNERIMTNGILQDGKWTWGDNGESVYTYL